MNVDIKEKLYKNISDYCRANHLVIKDYINELLSKSFMQDKYGERPFNQKQAVPYESPLPINKPTEVKIEVKKNEETKEYKVEMEETTIPIETGEIQLKDKEELNLLKDTVKSALAAYQKPVEEITIDTIKQALESAQEEEPVKEEKPKRRKLK